MNLLRVFHIGADRILAKNHSVPGRVTLVQRSCLYIIKKPVRLYVSDSNTLFSHYITFSYTVDQRKYTGKLFLGPRCRCPQKGEEIAVYYDLESPQNYACHYFGPAANPIGW